MLKLAKAKKGELVIDLGSGEGGIILTAVKKFGCKTIGYEVHAKVPTNLLSVELIYAIAQRIATTRRLAKEQGVEDLVTIIEDDLFNADVSKADIITMYCSNQINKRILPILQKQMKPGA